MARKRFNKKGDLFDFLYIIISLLLLSMVILVTYKSINMWNTATEQYADPYGQASNDQIEGMFPGVIDNSFLFLTIGLCLVSLFLASLTYFHPVFFVIFLPMIIFVVFLGGVFSNIYQAMAEQAVYADLANNLIYISHIMRYLPMIVGVFGFILAIVMYSKGQQ